VACDIQVLPHDQGLDGTEFKRFQRIVNTKAVLVRVLADFIEVLLDKPLLLYKLDVRQCVCRKFDGLHINISNLIPANPRSFEPYLVETILTTVAHIHNLNHLRTQTGIK
jgi:hypothetical protein